MTETKKENEMKSFRQALSGDERKALEAIINNVKAGKKMMKDGAILANENEARLWGRLNDLHPLENIRDKSFDFEDFEIIGFECNKEVERLKKLKEQAILDKDWEKAAEYRELERKEKEKEVNQKGE